MAGSWSEGRAALAALATTPVDVLVVDLGLPDMPGAEVVRGVRARPSPPEVVVLTAHGERAMALEALKAGATGYLLKGAPADLPAAIRVAAEGGSTIAPAIARYLLDEVRVPSMENGPGQVPLRDLGRGNEPSPRKAGSR